MLLLRIWNPLFTQWSSDDEAIRVIACYNERTKIETVVEFFQEQLSCWTSRASVVFEIHVPVESAINCHERFSCLPKTDGRECERHHYCDCFGFGELIR